MKTYIVGNWKMNFNVGESSIFLHKILQKLPNYRDIEIVVAPSNIALQPLSLQLDRKKPRKIKLAAQNVYYRDFGPFTGETSVSQLRGLVNYALIGHPERRHLFHETDKETRAKVAACIRNKITPILCIGETATERSFNETKDVIRDQLLGGLADIAEEDLKKVIIAYEPVWALSTTSDSKLASPTDVYESILFIRETLEKTYKKSTPDEIPLLYGGGITPSTAGAYLTIPHINGLLIGNASLISEQFNAIIEIAKRVKE